MPASDRSASAVRVSLRRMAWSGVLMLVTGVVLVIVAVVLVSHRPVVHYRFDATQDPGFPSDVTPPVSRQKVECAAPGSGPPEFVGIYGQGTYGVSGDHEDRDTSGSVDGEAASHVLCAQARSRDVVWAGVSGLAGVALLLGGAGSLAYRRILTELVRLGPAAPADFATS